MKTSLGTVGPLGSATPSLTERTIQAVRDAIHSGKLVPGELYSVYRIAEDLGVSRSPVRDALLRLGETGLVRFEPSRGFRVMVPGPKQLIEMVAVRIALEVPAAERAALAVGKGQKDKLQKEWEALSGAARSGDESLFMFHDQRLHGIILTLAGNTYVQRIIDNLRDATRLAGASTTTQGFRNLTEVLEEHRPLVEAILAGDGSRAAAAMDDHLRSTGRALLRNSLAHDDSGEDEAELWNSLVPTPTSLRHASAEETAND